MNVRHACMQGSNLISSDSQSLLSRGQRYQRALCPVTKLSYKLSYKSLTPTLTKPAIISALLALQCRDPKGPRAAPTCSSMLLQQFFPHPTHPTGLPARLHPSKKPWEIPPAAAPQAVHTENNLLFKTRM
jgi:hypothetical protein